MKAPAKPKRTATLEWVYWQAITAAIFLLNGGLYSFAFPYETTRIINVQAPWLYIPISIPGIVAIVGSLLIFLIENNVSLFAKLNLHITRVLLYLPLGLFCGLQLTMVQPAVFLVIISIELMFDAVWGLASAEAASKDKAAGGTMLPR
ncbi:hypothetical protein BASA50_009598 [Batrachochytrium salamandrivorans]|uniref:Uncharacterized protein n=1 Tax=Batrachochytrium salamandrivorans TaxID=1357716 RepID=A0ABQ8F1G4_9FUNG|nr:hypothetical protein BASA60_009146 [Batrachochytrium salamandrivorans]KAH6568881.1 hypothetical protein BASA62_005249 [Batrachochytrium salamandrivorans]KAH6590184.1 hypothetical protein BASA50_009598 [Batrachochytrium salamandrivorans]KAH6598978.1 hypothetical protein BASA61_002740 [Batrachochytrium salamandrivorans]KAH9266423.1 hypothetical protein BASA83_010540 [Batrachochytrium salamandrivorans]